MKAELYAVLCTSFATLLAFCMLRLAYTVPGWQTDKNAVFWAIVVPQLVERLVNAYTAAVMSGASPCDMKT